MITTLEQFVRRLMEDASFRAAAVSDPEKAVALFGLAGPERHGALQLCAQVGGPVHGSATAQHFWN